MKKFFLLSLFLGLATLLFADIPISLGSVSKTSLEVVSTSVKVTLGDESLYLDKDQIDYMVQWLTSRLDAMKVIESKGFDIEDSAWAGTVPVNTIGASYGCRILYSNKKSQMVLTFKRAEDILEVSAVEKLIALLKQASLSVVARADQHREFQLLIRSLKG